MTVRVGTAGWSIPAQYAGDFAAAGSHLQRYAARFSAVEINSSFYRPHRPATYARWAASAPADFRFAIKMPREITHARRLVGAEEPLDRFLGEIAALADKLGPILVQLPPSLQYDEVSAAAFFSDLRGRFAGPVVCEPRHASWFTTVADPTLARFRIARVAADPAPAAGAGQPGGWPGLIYRRLHGAPRVYYSAYAPEALDKLAAALRQEKAESWCIFDNTARGAAANDAGQLLTRL